ncbi:serine/threonine protein kinase [Pseudonocardia sp. KRD-184]|uniref:non-specific serine/threonine protein kinase n=1 Tax=Pseudonocardia oceani TaxID=2792013 RepID=A0ABS6U7T2_9PSEU|nr:serine/threonine-protein kinase [Pseudonocardia oceani]MBW0091178.1 serine/threonine protein kinase [Pseudonocardia oceani]MBW0098257.1 serine/threonine protein kinase [Pseudonocardia oceani]MBW0110856.1 serine/threonine protein kinase [Pseudonocardia oceani]MBW0122849.1 serine/threonine protein kinase [Pseudonocardia oceani]MBW0128267.1 serine/threonine protein kinase [Pseudonocardia oceani]
MTGPLSSSPGVIADRYELGPVVGTGGSAVVHRAWDRERRAVVALKVLHASAEVHDPRRHRREMDALTRVRHTGLVALHDGGVDAGTPYLVLDLVDGPSLAERIALDGPLDIDAVVALGARMAAALAAVHAAGIVHRDIKPANVLLEADGTPRLTDFGISRALDATTMTQSGAVLGTAAYLAPEQVRGHEVTGAADVYALGLVLLEALKGRREYPGGSVESATARLHRPPDVPRDLPRPLARALRSMTTADPARRLTAAAVAALLGADPAVETAPVAAVRRPWAFLAGALGAAAATLVAVLLTGAAPAPPPAAAPLVATPELSAPAVTVPEPVVASPVAGTTAPATGGASPVAVRDSGTGGTAEERSGDDGADEDRDDEDRDDEERDDEERADDSGRERAGSDDRARDDGSGGADDDSDSDSGSADDSSGSGGSRGQGHGRDGASGRN